MGLFIEKLKQGRLVSSRLVSLLLLGIARRQPAGRRQRIVRIAGRSATDGDGSARPSAHENLSAIWLIATTKLLIVQCRMFPMTT